MNNVYNFIWNYKRQITCLSFLFILVCGFKLKDFKIYFESERIIEELTTENLSDQEIKNINDKNIFLATINSKTEFEYEDFVKLNNKIKSIKKEVSIKRVFSLLNEKTIPNSSLIPIPKNKLSLSSKDKFEKTFDETSSFISKDKKSVFILFETREEVLKKPKDLLSLIKTSLSGQGLKINFAGRVPSEIYFQDKVSKEFILLAIFSAILCLSVMFFYTKNFAVVFTTFICVAITILASTSLALFFFGGIELFMIISPAIFFIVTVSDVMHLVNNQRNKFDDKKKIFLERLNEIGKPVLITSLTTMISFFSFVFIGIKPLSHFGIITGLGILIALFFSVLSYALLVKFDYDKIKPSKISKLIINKIINFLHKKKWLINTTLLIALIFSVVKVNDLKIDNYLLDELNKSSEFYQTSKYIDENFGGIKPFSIIVAPSKKSFKKEEFNEVLEDRGVTVDFSNETKQNKILYNYIFQDSSEVLKYNCRIADAGSNLSNEIYKNIQDFDQNADISFSGIGYLFDKTSDGLTIKLLAGLLLAIITVGIFLCLAYGLNTKMFFAGIIPNIIPLILTVGFVLYVFPFYLCLSNAFIFTVAFGLIIDDSIHVINAYMHYHIKGYKKEKIIEQINKKTANTILKTTTVVIACLLPLLISEFKSVSQIALLTSLAAIFAIIFDVGVLPSILNKVVDKN